MNKHLGLQYVGGGLGPQDHTDFNSYRLQVTPSYRLHPEMNKHLGLQYVGGGLGPLVNLRKYN